MTRPGEALYAGRLLWLTGLAIAAPTLAGCGGGSPEGASRTEAAAPAPGDTAAMYAAQLAESLGGRDAWNQTRYLSFRWIVERDGQVVANREHSWDRYDGRYRVAYEQDGTSYLLLFNVNEIDAHPELGKVPAGRAWMGGVELSEAARDSALRRGYGAFINDIYWALMPFKWEDPGVHLAYQGARTLSDGKQYATVHLTFDQGLGTTEDQYWGFLDESGRMAAWQYHLGRSEAPGDVIWWSDWRQVGDIQFAMTRVLDGGDRFIYFEDVAAAETVPEGRFDPPTR
ncbi:hypothetical protein [Candidatus Palauibacter sp.]|uniref:hypothetical protein n=1 Tax=Candidatus Palauibacter sp. TaxID=3101350 RepID=UPI003AF2BB53